MMNDSRSQKGVALITALLITAIATVAAVSLAARQHVDIRRTGNVMDSEQAYLFDLGIETVAKELLMVYSVKHAPYDEPEVLYQPYTFPVEGGIVSGNLVDMEAKFNINNILSNNKDQQGNVKVNEVQERRFRAILSYVLTAIQGDPAQADQLIAAVEDWIDEDQNVRFPGGAEDSDYISKEVPYRAANRMLASVSELLLIQGFSRELVYGKQIEEEFVPGLVKYVTVLPGNNTTININTIDKELLILFSKQWDQAMLDQALQDRPFKKYEDFSKHAVFNAILSVTDQAPQADRTRRDTLRDDLTLFDVRSNFFLVNANANVGNTNIHLYSMIYRDHNGPKIYTISHAIGTAGI